MKRMNDWQKWMVIEISTGAMDGYYWSRSLAEQSRTIMADQYPGGCYLVVSFDARRNPDAAIPDAMFWAERLPREPACEYCGGEGCCACDD
jgi:hypothetical protein